MKAPLVNVQLSAVEPLRIIMSAVPAPKVTRGTVILLLATKSFVAAKTSTGRSKDRIIWKIFFTISRELRVDYRTAQKLIEVPPSVVSATPSSPVFKTRRLMVETPVEDAAWIINGLSKELVACTKTRSLDVSAPRGVVVQSKNFVVEAVKLVTFANEQYPKTRPLIVGAAGSSPTLIAEVLAVPTSTTSVAPRVIVPFVELVIVSPLSNVTDVEEAIPPS